MEKVKVKGPFKTSPNCQPGHAVRAVNNKARKVNPVFVKACEDAGIPVTTRQAAKWNNGKGKAFKMVNRIPMNGIRFDV